VSIRGLLGLANVHGATKKMIPFPALLPALCDGLGVLQYLIKIRLGSLLIRLNFWFSAL
jgi:hypothetical protein